MTLTPKQRQDAAQRSLVEIAQKSASKRAVDYVQPIDEEHITLLKMQGYEKSLVDDYWIKYE